MEDPQMARRKRYVPPRLQRREKLAQVAASQQPVITGRFT